jgi:hypothetical protein
VGLWGLEGGTMGTRWLRIDDKQSEGPPTSIVGSTGIMNHCDHRASGQKDLHIDYTRIE